MKLFTYFVFALSVAATLLHVYLVTYPSLNAANCSWSHMYKDYSSLSPLSQWILSLPYVGDVYDQLLVPETRLPQDPADIRLLAIGDPQINGNWPSTKYIKRLDNYGNDYYLGHIYNVMKTRLQPSHVAVMGDLFSSQWISDSEYYNRTRRFITRLFPQPEEHSRHNLDFLDEHKDVDWNAFLEKFQKSQAEGKFSSPDQYHYENVFDWTEHNVKGEPLFINLTGNHDIGYGDTTYQHMARFTRLFGKDNYWIEYDTKTDHPWRIVVLNSLALDGPMVQPEFQRYTWEFVDLLAERPFNGSTVLLTHIPMYKPAGLCRDGPFMELYTKENAVGEYAIGKLKSENHLQYETSQRVMNSIFRNGKPGIIMTGHDHEGCENHYNLDPQSRQWYASKQIETPVHVEEITVRSIMGDFDGTTGLMTGHFDREQGEWQFTYTQCPFIVQHVWWASKVTWVVVILALSAQYLFKL